MIGGMATNQATRPQRWRLRFSLRTLVVFVLLIGSTPALYLHYEPWRVGLTLHGHARFVRTASFSSDGRWIVTAGADLTARIWDADTGTQLLLIPQSGGAEFSPDGERVLTFGDRLRVHDSKSGEMLREFGESNEYVSRACFSPDGLYVVAAGWGGTVSLWDVKTGEKVRDFKHGGNLTDAEFSPDGRKLISCSYWGTVIVWDADTGVACWTMKTPGAVLCAAFSPSGTRIAFDCAREGSKGNSVPIYAWSGDELFALHGHTSRIESLHFSSDERRIATASWDGSIGIWDYQSGGTPLARMRLPFEPDDMVPYAYRASFSPDATRLVACGGTGDAFVYVRHRPEYWWGVACLPEFWLVVFFGSAFVWSLWRDRRRPVS